MSTHPTLPKLAQQLVLSLIPELKEVKDRGVTNQLANHVLREVRNDVHGGARKEWDEVKGNVEGLSRTAQIKVQTDLAEALDKNLRTLERCRDIGSKGWEEDVPIRMGNLPQHIHLLLNLSTKPTSQTHDFAHSYLHCQLPQGPTADQILYREIMETDPYDPGEVYDEEVLSGWTDSDSDDLDVESSSEDRGTSSAEDEDIRTPDTVALRAQRRRAEEQRKKEEEEDRKMQAEEVVRGLKEGYWNRPGEVGEMKEGLYGWKELTTGASAAAIAARVLTERGIGNKAVKASQLQRELIFALSGRPGVLFDFTSDRQCTVKSDHPQVQYLSPGALEGLLETFKIRATQAAQIRAFIDTKLLSTPSSSSSGAARRQTSKVNRTQQAFAEACRGVINGFDTWLSEQEAAFTLGSVTGTASAASTPLLLNLELEKQHAPLLEHLSSFIPHSRSPTILLNLIYSTIISLNQTMSSHHLPALHYIFLLSAQPTWRILGKWLRHGMPIPSSLTDPEQSTFSTFDDETELDQEFFITRDRDVSWADEDFWECGFVVGGEGWPLWMGEEVGEMVLEAGKARGLLRSLLGNVASVEEWSSLNEVVGLPTSTLGHDNGAGLGYETVDILESVTTHLKPMCQITQFHLRRVLDEECGLDQHLDAIEGMMYLKGFEVMHDWALGLFDKVKSGAKWKDFQILTSTLRDSIEKKQAGWMNPSAVRVPFPLSQLFTSTSIELRAEVFSLLLQLSLGRYLLAGTKGLDKEVLSRCHTREDESEIRSLWLVRQKITWFLEGVSSASTLYIWLTGRVIETQTKVYRTKLESMTSLRSMIALELEHTRSIRDYAFLNPASFELHEAILSILDMTNTISECVTSFLAQTIPNQSETRPTPGPSSNNITERRKPRQRQRQRRRRKDISSSDEEDSNEVVRHDPKEGWQVGEASISFVELSLGQRIERMNKELEDAVALIKKGVDGLAQNLTAGGGGEVWGMLSWDLEEWK
nr:uncharacterized protein CI109_005488 [Kwoniella shandongensis]KAA5526210.1 hypothetical protein CI109_005488 [Kwoniella shandongensis]